MAYMGFNALKAKIAARGGVRDAGAVAAAIGRKKYGQKAMTHASVMGREKGHSAAMEYMKGLHGSK